MKKMLFSLFMLSSFSVMLATSYSDLRENFKHQLYRRQQGLMSEKRYKLLIESYLQEAEKTLAMPGHIRDHADSVLAQEYFNALADFNVDRWMNLISTPIYKGGNPYRYRLHCVIEKIKNEWQLADLDVALELKKTEDFLEKKNEHYYKKLNFIRKVQLFSPLDSMFKLIFRG